MTTTTEDDLFSNPTRRADPDEDIIRNGRYFLPHPKSGRDAYWTRATTFAKTISDTYTLNMWGRRMAIKGLTMREDLYALAAATPLEDRDTLNDIAERCAETAGSKSAAALGTALHGFTEQHDRGEKPNVPAKWQPDVKAYVAALSEHGIEVVPNLIERVVIVPRFGVAGKFDRVYRVTRDCEVRLGDEVFTLEAGTLIMGDLKTGRTLEYAWGEIVVQLWLYANAEAIFDRKTRKYEPMPEIDKRVAVVVHLPVGQHMATVFDLNLALGEQAASLCATVREWRKVKGLAVPRLVTRAEPAAQSDSEPVVEVEDPAGWGVKLDTARTIDDLSAIWREANLARQWSPALEARGHARRAQILADTRGERTE
jgi:hypothetical protein